MKQLITKILNQNNTRPYHSQPLSKDYSQPRWVDKCVGVTQMQTAFINALMGGIVK